MVVVSGSLWSNPDLARVTVPVAACTVFSGPITVIDRRTTSDESIRLARTRALRFNSNPLVPYRQIDYLNMRQFSQKIVTNFGMNFTMRYSGKISGGRFLKTTLSGEPEVQRCPGGDSNPHSRLLVILGGPGGIRTQTGFKTFRECSGLLPGGRPEPASDLPSASGAKAADQASHDSDWRLNSQRRPRMGEQLLELPGGLSPPVWPLKYDVQLIGQSEDTKMRFHPKGGIEHRQYLRLKNVVASVRGFPRQGGLRVGQGKTCQTLNFSQCCANSVAN